MHSSFNVSGAGLFACLLAIAGCSPTYVNFDGPPGTVMFVNDKPYHLPTQIEFWRPAGVGQSNRYNIKLAFNTPQTGEVRASGTIDVYGYNESDVDRLVANNCRLAESELSNLANGKILVYKAVTASKQSLFDLTLSKR